jgi:DNA-binding NtrC family response regulator
MAEGDEILIAHGPAAYRDALRGRLEAAGYVCTTTDRPDQARDLVARKFFPAALVDLDFEGPRVGLDVMRSIREHSSPTALVLLTARRSFEAAVEAFRLGAVDVVDTRLETLDYVERIVDVACDHQRADEAESGAGSLLPQVQLVLDEAFHIILEMGRRHYADVSMASMAAFRPQFLVVDSDQDLLRELAVLLHDEPWEIAAEMTGGGALDKAGVFRFDVVACRAELMDLRGSMVVKSIQAQEPITVGVVYTTPGPEGRLDLYRKGRLTDTVRPFVNAKQLVDLLERIANELGTTTADRRVISAFRSDHPDFFRRYAELKTRLAALLQD